MKTIIEDKKSNSSSIKPGNFFSNILEKKPQQLLQHLKILALSLLAFKTVDTEKFASKLLQILRTQVLPLLILELITQH
ncbi:MAG: hypothetical protein AB8B68_03485 [Rickettsiaceae bacterium]